LFIFSRSVYFGSAFSSPARCQHAGRTSSDDEDFLHNNCFTALKVLTTFMIKYKRLKFIYEFRKRIYCGDIRLKKGDEFFIFQFQITVLDLIGRFEG